MEKCVWLVKQICESDYGCEERMPGEPLTVMVILESDDGRQCRFEVADSWLTAQDINEGDVWPEDIDDDSDTKQALIQQEFMNSYYDAIEELNE